MSRMLFLARGRKFHCHLLPKMWVKIIGPYIFIKPQLEAILLPSFMRNSRLVPKATIDLEKHVKKYLVGLPTATIITLSLLGHEYTTLLQELPLPYSFHTSVQAWMIVSRLNFEAEPLVMLLPLDYISQDEGDLSKYEKPEEDWDCPWGCFTVVDDLIPTFRTMLEENCLEREPMKKLDIDKRFGELLRNLEDFWFGSWKYVLRGIVELQKIRLHAKKPCEGSKI